MSYLDSEPTAVSYLKEIYKIPSPVIVNPPASDENEDNEAFVLVWDEVDDSRLKEYKVTLKDSKGNKIKQIATKDTSVSFGTEEGIVIGESYSVEIVAAANDGEENSNPAIISFDTTFGGGTGTKENPYIISLFRHFNNIPDNAIGYYNITGNIDLTKEEYIPKKEFGGILYASFFDDKKTIKLNVERSENNAGLFLSSKDGARFENLIIEGTVKQTSAGSLANTGALVGKALGTLTVNGCVNNAEITSLGGNTGGFVGNAVTLNIQNSINNNNISSKQVCGGLAGKISASGTVKGCVNNGRIISAENFAGGLVADGKSIEMEFCINNSDVTSVKYSGGLLGYERGTAIIKKSYNKGFVDSTSSASNGAGGLVGYSTGGVTIENSYNTGNVKTCAENSAGGILGFVISGKSANISMCYNLGEILENENPGAPFLTENTKGIRNILNCYYLSHSETSDGGRTDEMLKQKETFYGFDFDYIWDINGEYPLLRRD